MALVFPTYASDNLSKKKMTIPQDFNGKNYNIVFVAFAREQQDDIDTWVPAVTTLLHRFGREALNFYEIPVIDRPNWLVQKFITEGTLIFRIYFSISKFPEWISYLSV